MEEVVSSNPTRSTKTFQTLTLMTKNEVLGCLLGGALGDAWGGPYEGRAGPLALRSRRGQILEVGYVNPENIAAHFLSWFRAGISHDDLAAVSGGDGLKSITADLAEFVDTKSFLSNFHAAGAAALRRDLPLMTQVARRVPPIRKLEWEAVDQSAGTTRRLFRISSVSVRRNAAPILGIHSRVGRPNGTPQASRSRRMNSAFGSGFGEATFAGSPSISSRSISQRTAATKSS